MSMAPGVLTIFTGAKGIGKTVMLDAAHDVAREHGWAVVSETATAGFLGRIGESMRRLAEELGSGPQGRRITAVAAAGFDITSQLLPERQVAWRTLGESLLRLLDERGTGLVAGLPARSRTCSTRGWRPSCAGQTRSTSTPRQSGRWRNPSPPPSPKQASPSPPSSSGRRPKPPGETRS